MATEKHDPTYFTQGLVRDGDGFVESIGKYGDSALVRWSSARGEIARRDMHSGLFGEGLARLGGELWQLTWKAGRAFVYGADDLRLRRTFPYFGEGWGLASDDETLIMSDGSERLYARNAEEFSVTKITRVYAGSRPVTRLNELEYVNGVVWANIWLTDRIARIDYATGCVTGWLDLSGLWPRSLRPRTADVLNGIAADPVSGHLFVTGKYWPRIYEIEVGPAHSL